MHRYSKLSREDLLRLLREAEMALQAGAQDDSRQVLHALQLHKIELEIQNRELRQAQQALEESRDRYADLFDFAPVGYLTLDDRGVIRNLNLSAATLLGQERARLRDRPLSPLLAPLSSGRLFDHLRSAFLGEQPVVDELRLRPGPDGTARAICLDSKVRTDPQGVRRCFTTLIDISERKRAEGERGRLQRELTQARKMQALGQLTGGIAHDFNNILAIVLGFTEIMQRSLRATDEEKSKHYLAEIERAGRRAGDLVARLLAFSRCSPVEQQPLTLLPLVKEAVTLSRSTFPASIQFTDNLQPVPTVMLNPVELQQVLLNLFLNARDAMDNKGTIQVALRTADFHAAECATCHKGIHGRWVELTVEDSGSGIAEKDRERIFEPFFTTKPVGEGSGMGLAVVQGIMQRAQGHLILDSPPGRGAAFRLLFPIAATSAVAVPDESDAVAAGVDRQLQGRILLVDDEPFLAEMLNDALAMNGLEVTVMQDSRAALKLLADDNFPFDLILTDQTMPAVTGLELADAARHAHPQVRIVLMSGYSAEIEALSAEQLDVDRFLTKPLSIGKLIETVSELLP